MKIFAYGSNMFTNKLKINAPSASKICNAFIKGYILKCNKKSADQSAKGNIIRTGNEEDVVWGVIWTIDEQDKLTLDLAEGLGQGYIEETLSFLDSENGTHEAQVYIADNSAIADGLHPYDWYKEYIISGAVENNLAQDYIEKLKLIDFIEDTNEERRKKHFEILHKPQLSKSTKAQSVVLTMNKGSEWRKWDLHVHTPATLCSDYGGNNDEIWKNYFEVLETLSTEKNIKVLGINDYLFLEGYEKVLKYKKDGGLKNVELLLPVVEIRLREFVGNKDLGRINYHIIFADDSLLKVEQINAQFLSSLIGRGNLDVQNPNGYTWGGVITRETLIDLGNHIIENTPIDKRTNASPIDIGFNNLNFELSDITNLLGEGEKPNTFLKDKYFKAIGKAEWGDFRWEQSPLEKKSIINSTHFVFSASPTVEMALAGKESLIEQGVNSRLLHCSDSHSFAKDSNNTNSKELGHCFTWIKTQPTFEGLKQIIFEPDERVKIQKEKPDSEKLDNLIIEKVTFTSSENKFTPEPIYFNKNLNVIIGGKSSGKSILLYEIARTLYANVKDEVLSFKDVEDNNSIKDLYNLSENDNKYDFSIELYSKSRQNKKDRQEQSSILPSIKYIPQNHLSNLVDKSRKNGATLKKLIRDLILEDPESNLKYNDFVGQAKKNDEQRNQDIDYYFSLKSELQKKEAELQLKGDTKALNEGIQFNKQKIEQLNKDFSPEELTRYKELTEKLNQFKIRENQVYSDFEKIDNFLTELKRYLSEFSNKKNILLESMQNENIKKEYNIKLGFIDESLNNVNELFKQVAKNENNEFIENSFFLNEFSNFKAEKDKTENELEPFNKKLENQKQVAALQKSIGEDEAKIALIEQFKKEIETTKGAILLQKEKIYTDFKQNYQLYKKIIADLQSRISRVQNESDKIEILPSVKYNFPKFRRLADDIFDGRGFNNQGFEYIYQYWDKNPKSALVNVQFEEIELSLKTLFDRIEKKQILPKGGNTEKDAVKKIFTDFFFDHWDVKSQGDDIHQMSTGKASFVLLKLIIKLSNENGPILIDQPEDNLDNRSVSKELVDFLKDKKRERQIILVTHNPNIVVNADAENIIVANQKGQNDVESTSDFKFDYINGALEDSFAKNSNTDLLKSMGIREHIAEIVEGGKEAFKKREEKYGFK